MKARLARSLFVLKHITSSRKIEAAQTYVISGTGDKRGHMYHLNKQKINKHHGISTVYNCVTPMSRSLHTLIKQDGSQMP